jgi:hypothetical protein
MPNETRKRRNITISPEMEEYAREIGRKVSGGAKTNMSLGIEIALREKMERERKGKSK